MARSKTRAPLCTVAPQETIASFSSTAPSPTVAPIRTTAPDRITARRPTVAPISADAPSSSTASCATVAPIPTPGPPCRSWRRLGATNSAPPAAAAISATAISQGCPVAIATTSSTIASTPSCVATGPGCTFFGSGRRVRVFSSASRVRDRLLCSSPAI